MVVLMHVGRFHLILLFAFNWIVGCSSGFVRTSTWFIPLASWSLNNNGAGQGQSWGRFAAGMHNILVFLQLTQGPTILKCIPGGENRCSAHISRVVKNLGYGRFPVVPAFVTSIKWIIISSCNPTDDLLALLPRDNHVNAAEHQDQKADTD